jgi:hypothetical protein
MSLSLSAACATCTAAAEGPEPGTGAVPAALSSIEGTAEDSYDKALAGDLAAVATDAASIDAAWQGFRAQAGADGATSTMLAATDAAVATMVTAAAGSDGMAAARAANGVSAAMPDLFALYQPAVPPALLALDYLGRELVLDAREADFGGAVAHLADLQATWQSARSLIVDAGGAAAAASYDQSVASLQADIDAASGATLEIEAQTGLDLVDTMEQLFAGK